MKKIISISLLVCISLIITGCSTKYQSNGLTGGYQETQLGKNIFIVSFKGNGYTSKEKVVDFTLLRSAELTLENGFKYFSIIDKDSDISIHQTSPSYNTYGTVNRYDGSVNLRTTQSGGFTFRKASQSNTIVCYIDEPINQISYEAKFIYDSLRKKYEIE